MYCTQTKAFLWHADINLGPKNDVSRNVAELQDSETLTLGNIPRTWMGICLARQIILRLVAADTLPYHPRVCLKLRKRQSRVLSLGHFLWTAT